MIKVPVNKIIHLSVVDGPGNRASVFLQDCNISCAYCHNPETQNMCCGCGECVDGCPTHALTSDNHTVTWDSNRCISCDNCILTCKYMASPKIRYMSAADVINEIMPDTMFIRGLTVSGGECMLYPEFLTQLGVLAHKLNLTFFLDSNGTIEYSKFPELMRVTDKVMLDVKSWNETVYHTLTGGDVGIVKTNLRYLAEQDKLHEVRIVCQEDMVDVEDDICGIADTVGSNIDRFKLKLIRFRDLGVRGALKGAACPSMEQMEYWKKIAINNGFFDICIV